MTREHEARRGTLLWLTLAAVALAVSIVRPPQGREAWQVAIVVVLLAVAGGANAWRLRRLKAARTRPDAM